MDEDENYEGAIEAERARQRAIITVYQNVFETGNPASFKRAVSGDLTWFAKFEYISLDELLEITHNAVRLGEEKQELRTLAARALLEFGHRLSYNDADCIRAALGATMYSVEGSDEDITACDLWKSHFDCLNGVKERLALIGSTKMILNEHYPTHAIMRLIKNIEPTVELGPLRPDEERRVREIWQEAFSDVALATLHKSQDRKLVAEIMLPVGEKVSLFAALESREILACLTDALQKCGNGQVYRTEAASDLLAYIAAEMSLNNPFYDQFVITAALYAAPNSPEDKRAEGLWSDGYNAKRSNEERFKALMDAERLLGGIHQAKATAQMVLFTRTAYNKSVYEATPEPRDGTSDGKVVDLAAFRKQVRPNP